jgi:hypothetical protein
MYKLTKLASAERTRIDNDPHSLVKLQPRRALLELLERALGEEVELEAD